MSAGVKRIVRNKDTDGLHHGHVVLPSDQVRLEFADLLKSVSNGETVVISYYGIMIAALVPLAVLDGIQGCQYCSEGENA